MDNNQILAAFLRATRQNRNVQDDLREAFMQQDVPQNVSNNLIAPESQIPQENMADIRNYVNVAGGGSSRGMGGLLAARNVPLGGGVTAEANVMPFYVPRMKMGGVSGYGGAVNVDFGKNNAHSLRLEGQQMQGQMEPPSEAFPFLPMNEPGIPQTVKQYMLKYGYKF